MLGEIPDEPGGGNEAYEESTGGAGGMGPAAGTAGIERKPKAEQHVEALACRTGTATEHCARKQHDECLAGYRHRSERQREADLGGVELMRAARLDPAGLPRQSPAAKLEQLQARHAAGAHILMVGDGVNDAPVLAAADVSMTVKGGAELANSTADMILTAESLELVQTAREIARRTRQLIRQNLTWAVLYNTSVMPLAVSGMLKPWMAALGMSLSSLLVVANAARLVKEKSAGEGSEP